MASASLIVMTIGSRRLADPDGCISGSIDDASDTRPVPEPHGRARDDGNVDRDLYRLLTDRRHAGLRLAAFAIGRGRRWFLNGRDLSLDLRQRIDAARTAASPP